MLAEINVIWFALSAGVVLLLPGLALKAVLYHKHTVKTDLLSALADAVAFSVALSALLGLWLMLAGLRLPAFVVTGLYAACLVFVLAAAAWRMPMLRAVEWKPLGLASAAAVIGLALLVMFRFYQARDLVLPAWVDSVHHTLLVRLILETGGLPRDFLPYVPAPNYYHYGFHLVAALFALVSDFPTAQAVLWFGQVINAAASLSVYRAAESMLYRGRPEERNGYISARPFIALLLTGFAFQMPGYYLSWGRYTLLAGLILVGPAIAAALEAVQHPGQKAGWAKLALLVAGMSLTHYFALLIFGLFLVVLGAMELFKTVRSRRWDTLLRLMLWTAVGILAALPWIIWLLQNTGHYSIVQVSSMADFSEAAQKRAADTLRYLVSLLGPRHNHIFMGISAVGWLFALRKESLRLLFAWTALLVMFALPWSPRLGPFRPDHFVIVLFFPAAILLSDLLFACAEAMRLVIIKKSARVGLWVERFVLAVLVCGLLVYGIRENRSVLNRATVIGVSADVQALDWVALNTSPAARFYINSVPWQGSYRGVDGGYWLMPYTGRASLVPPIFYVWGDPGYSAQVNDWAKRSQELNGCTPSFWEIVREANLTHVYLREGTGQLQPAMLSDCPRLKIIYTEEGISVYEILRPE